MVWYGFYRVSDLLFTGQTASPGLSANGRIDAKEEELTGRLTEGCGRKSTLGSSGGGRKAAPTVSPVTMILDGG